MRISLDSAMGVFQKAVDKLEKFTKQCDDDISVCQAKIDEAQRSKSVYEDERSRAQKSLDKIREIVG